MNTSWAIPILLVWLTYLCVTFAIDRATPAPTVTDDEGKRVRCGKVYGADGWPGFRTTA